MVEEDRLPDKISLLPSKPALSPPVETLEATTPPSLRMGRPSSQSAIRPRRTIPERWPTLERLHAALPTNESLRRRRKRRPLRLDSAKQNTWPVQKPGHHLMQTPATAVLLVVCMNVEKTKQGYVQEHQLRDGSILSTPGRSTKHASVCGIRQGLMLQDK